MAVEKVVKVGSLKDSVPDSEIVRLGEIRNEPNYIFPDGEYGITGKYRDYSLVKKRIAYKTGTKEDGEYEGCVIEYVTYEDVPCFSSSFVHIFDEYARILNLTEFKKKKMRTEIKDLVGIHKETNGMIKTALKGVDTYMDKNQGEICDLSETKQRLLNDIKELQQQKTEMEKILKDINKMHNEIKQARTIIVDMDKPKKRKLKLEKEEEE